VKASAVTPRKSSCRKKPETSRARPQGRALFVFKGLPPPGCGRSIAPQSAIRKNGYENLRSDKKTGTGFK
jgi:hypothetical protein